MQYLSPIVNRLVHKKIGEPLLEAGAVTESQINSALSHQEKTGEKIGSILIKSQAITEEQLQQALDKQKLKAPSFDSDQEALSYLHRLNIPKENIINELEHYYGISYIDLSQTDINPAIFGILDIDNLIQQNILPFALKGQTICFAIADIGAQYAQENLAALCSTQGYSSEFFFAFAHELQSKYKQIKKAQKSQEAVLVDEGGAIEWVNNAIQKGIDLKASDIHIEPQERGIQVRFRIDGILAIRDYFDFSPDFIQSITTRLKIISNMDIAEKRKPQDGRLNDFIHKNQKYDLRVSSVATNYGEKLVLRIFNKDTAIKSFAELGFNPTDENKIKQALTAPYGIIYLGGATGSGKTTTLYTMINYINDTKINIYTIEDPIEKTIKNVNQIQVNPLSGVTYTNTLRSLLRQDPDVIVVGETRDQETAALAIESSLTGHLVLTTIHANNALDVTNRLYDMGIEPYLISASTIAFISQKLIRVLCPHCKENRPFSAIDEQWLRRTEATYGLDPWQNELYYPVGCPQCNNIGYKGRQAVAEIVLIQDEKARQFIAHKEIDKLHNYVVQHDFASMGKSAYDKVIQGITSTYEVLAIT